MKILFTLKPKIQESSGNPSVSVMKLNMSTIPPPTILGMTQFESRLKLRKAHESYVAPDIEKTLILYVFHEMNANVRYFMEHGLFESPDYDFLLIINNPDNDSIRLDISQSNVSRMYRENIGFDFGGWFDGLTQYDRYLRYDRFLFVNSSVMGPFVQKSYDKPWPEIFFERLIGDNLLVGPTANPAGYIKPDHISIHLNSVCFGMRKYTLEYLLECGIFSEKNKGKEKYAIIKECEVKMSRDIIDAGFNIAPLMKFYKGVDFRDKSGKIPILHHLGLHPLCIKKYITSPYEICFVKNRFYAPPQERIDYYFGKGAIDISSWIYHNNWILDWIKSINKNLVSVLTDIVSKNYGVEIGGPSNSTGKLIYQNCLNMDNVIFNYDTIWSKHTSEYKFYNEKIGKVIINDAVDISNIMGNTYDFCFSSHSLEHIANPLKAIKEWLRIVKPNGHIIIVVPEKSKTFDHRRDYTEFSTILDQYIRDVGEDDLSTLPEILSKHDLSMDPPAGNIIQFKERSLNNFHNRCLHHYVYDDELLINICNYFKCEFIFKVTQGVNRWFIMKKL